MVRRMLILVALAISLPAVALLGVSGQATASQIHVSVHGKLSPHPSTVPNTPGFSFCAKEGQTCPVSGVTDVAYGANGRFYFKDGVKGSIACTDAVFGDPVFGVVKFCYTITPASRYSSAVLASQPWAYWQVNEKPQSSVAVDATGNGHDGSYASCVKLGQPGPIPDDPDTAGYFTGRGCWMISTPSASYAGAYTVEAWVRPCSSSKNRSTFFETRGLIGEYSLDVALLGSANPSGQALHIDVGDGQEWLISQTGANVPFAFTAGHWYYIVVTVSPVTNTVVFYVNGKHFADVGMSNFGLPPLLFDPVHPMAVGGDPRYDPDPTNPYPAYFDGTIGQVAVYERALTADTVAAHYAAAGR